MILSPVLKASRVIVCLALAIALCTVVNAESPLGEEAEGQIEIIEGENRTIYEYRQNGILTKIKIVPEKGPAYYLVPADGAPHYESLDHKRALYPQWIIKEW